MKNVPKLRFKEFTDEWEEKKLSELSNKIGDGIHSTPNYSDNGEYFFINGNNIKDNKVFINETTKKIDEEEYNKYRLSLNNNTILISINGTIGNLGYYNYEKVILGKSCGYINLKDESNKCFLLNLLKTQKIQSYFFQELTGTTIKNLSLQTLKNTIVKLPIFNEQQKIADFLSTVDQKISIIEEKLNLFNEYKKGIMQKIFSQELRFKDENGNDYPEWEEKKLKDLTESISNGISLNQNFDGIGYKVTRIETISSGKINLEKIGYITTDKNIDEYKLNIGDLLFSNINSVEHIGKIAYIDKNYDLYHGMNLLRIVFNKNLCSKYFYYILTERKYKKLFEKLCNKAVSQASINQTELGKIKVYVPCLEEQQKIADFLSAIDTKIEKISDELENLKEFKKGLLQQMFV